MKIKKPRPMCTRHKKLRQDGFICLAAISMSAVSVTAAFVFRIHENHIASIITLVLAVLFFLISFPYSRAVIKYGDSKTYIIRNCRACTRLNESEYEH